MPLVPLYNAAGWHDAVNFLTVYDQLARNPLILELFFHFFLHFRVQFIYGVGVSTQPGNSAASHEQAKNYKLVNYNIDGTCVTSYRYWFFHVLFFPYATHECYNLGEAVHL